MRLMMTSKGPRPPTTQQDMALPAELVPVFTLADPLPQSHHNVTNTNILFTNSSSFSVLQLGRPSDVLGTLSTGLSDCIGIAHVEASPVLLRFIQKLLADIPAFELGPPATGTGALLSLAAAVHFPDPVIFDTTHKGLQVVTAPKAMVLHAVTLCVHPLHLAAANAHNTTEFVPPAMNKGLVERTLHSLHTFLTSPYNLFAFTDIPVTIDRAVTDEQTAVDTLVQYDAKKSQLAMPRGPSIANMLTNSIDIERDMSVTGDEGDSLPQPTGFDICGGVLLGPPGYDDVGPLMLAKLVSDWERRRTHDPSTNSSLAPSTASVWITPSPHRVAANLYKYCDAAGIDVIPRHGVHAIRERPRKKRKVNPVTHDAAPRRPNLQYHILRTFRDVRRLSQEDWKSSFLIIVEADLVLRVERNGKPSSHLFPSPSCSWVTRWHFLNLVTDTGAPRLLKGMNEIYAKARWIIPRSTDVCFGYALDSYADFILQSKDGTPLALDQYQWLLNHCVMRIDPGHVDVPGIQLRIHNLRITDNMTPGDSSDEIDKLHMDWLRRSRYTVSLTAAQFNFRHETFYLDQLDRMPNATCSICWGEPNQTCVNAILENCGHIFCEPCAERLAHTSDACPLCRKLGASRYLVIDEAFGEADPRATAFLALCCEKSKEEKIVVLVENESYIKLLYDFLYSKGISATRRPDLVGEYPLGSVLILTRYELHERFVGANLNIATCVVIYKPLDDSTKEYTTKESVERLVHLVSRPGQTRPPQIHQLVYENSHVESARFSTYRHSLSIPVGYP